MVPVTLNQRGERVYRPYHQNQVQSRCGLHAINNAMGSPSKCCLNFTFIRGPTDLGQPASVTVDMAATTAQRLRAEEASFLGVNASTVRPFMQPGKASSSPFVFQAPPPIDTLILKGGNQMDVSLVARLLHMIGQSPEFVTSYGRSLRLASSAAYDGWGRHACLSITRHPLTTINSPTFILNTGSHFVTYALRMGTWWVGGVLLLRWPRQHVKTLHALYKRWHHDSLKDSAVPLSHYQVSYQVIMLRISPPNHPSTTDSLSKKLLTKLANPDITSGPNGQHDRKVIFFNRKL